MPDFKILESALLDIRFPIARYHLVFVVTKDIHFNGYSGSAIRGAFGHALRAASCMLNTDENNNNEECRTCPYQDCCTYRKVFEPKLPSGQVLQKFSKIPVPYVIEAPVSSKSTYKRGEKFSFNIVLCGRALEDFLNIIDALRSAMSKDIGHGRAEFESIYLVEQSGRMESVYSEKTFSIKSHESLIRLFPLTSVSRVKLSFITPLRIQDNSRIIKPDEITARTLLITLLRRVDLILKFHCDIDLKLPFKEISELLNNVEIKCEMAFKDWERFSNRQNQRMKLGGYVGNVYLSNLPGFMMPLIQLGEYLHVGKNAVFGLGSYRIYLV